MVKSKIGYDSTRAEMRLVAYYTVADVVVMGELNSVEYNGVFYFRAVSDYRTIADYYRASYIRAVANFRVAAYDGGSRYARVVGYFCIACRKNSR